PVSARWKINGIRARSAGGEPHDEVNTQRLLQTTGSLQVRPEYLDVRQLVQIKVNRIARGNRGAAGGADGECSRAVSRNRDVAVNAAAAAALGQSECAGWKVDGIRARVREPHIDERNTQALLQAGGRLQVCSEDRDGREPGEVE